MFPDIETALMDYLEDLGYTVTSTPADLVSRLPVIRIQRVGGSDDGENDYPRVSVQTFAAGSSEKPTAARDLAETIRDRLNHELPAMSKPGGFLLDSSSTESGPSSYPWPDPSVRVAQAIYRLTTRRTD